eukprot:CAMPEP_0171355922 /NCGR_PEP_ID=MMETSP0878-20121228/45464_1 /TAXON_ID=67004 /ORGANISM="Thalassiosira weissflogii, Strain CCMP1336" /LENGTH=820 /DNA_ID=CAMNT_0011861929 /DNA_START=337 /DNA_END=2799 /DNA_ORIENTATION=+
MTGPDDVGASTRESCNNEDVSDEDSDIPFYNETAISNADDAIVIANETVHTDASESNGLSYTSKTLRKPIKTETKTSSEQNASTNSGASARWEANDFENDRRLLKLAIARQNNMVNLQQRHRRYVLDHGFARNRRPLMHDLFKIAFSIGGGMIFLILGGAGKSLGCDINISGKHLPWRSKILSVATQIMIVLNKIHYWLIGVATPLLLLTWAKFDDEIAQCRSDKTVRKLSSTRQKMKMQLIRWLKIPRFGPMARILDEYSNDCVAASTNAPSAFYSIPHTNPKSSRKDTGNFVLCLLENWSSAVIGSFLTGMCTILCSSEERRLLKNIVVGRGVEVDAQTTLLKSLSRLIIRFGATASLYQYPSLLFELRRNDQPRPLSRSTTIMQSATNVWLRWLPLGVTTDLAVVVGSLVRTSSMLLHKRKFPGVSICSILSVLPPILHLIALSRIVRVSKSTTDSLSKATVFPETNGIDEEVDFDKIEIEENGILAKEAQWRYQLRWRSPQRLIDLLSGRINYFFTGHNALITEIDDFKKQPIRFNEFSTEGTFFLTKREKNAINRMENGDFIPHADAITESLSLIFRDRGAAITNATRSRSSRHEESFKKKEFEDLLGIAVQQTFGIGVSYDFDHFDPPSDGEEISIHQLRARLAKSGIRRKKELEKSMNTELEVLQRLRDNVITNNNRMQAENEVQLTEEHIRLKYGNETDRIKKSLLTLIPTNAEPPAGKEEMYENPIIVARYTDLNAPINRKDLKATVESAPDSLDLVEEYVRREYGEKAAEAYREEELLSRQRAKQVRSQLRERYRKLDDKDEFQGNDSDR